MGAATGGDVNCIWLEGRSQCLFVLEYDWLWSDDAFALWTKRSKILKNEKQETVREAEDQMGDWDGLAGQTGRCLWAIIYKLFNLGYFLALGNG